MEADHTVGNIRTKKALLRKDVLAKRHGMTRQECEDLSAVICRKFLEGDDYRSADTILLYKAYNNEVDTDMIFKKAVSDGKKVAFPLSRIVDGEPDLSFYFINDLSQLAEGYMGIREPKDTGSLTRFDGRADVCISPGVAFDRKCHRIGYGKAFYDRYIRLNTPQKVIGLAYDLQITGDFETEDSDVTVDLVITDKAVYAS